MKRKIIILLMIFISIASITKAFYTEDNPDIEQESNANLKSLRLDIPGIEPKFAKDNYQYYLTVANDIKDIDVLVESSNPNAKVEISGNTNLKQGLNTITISVTSEDKTNKNEYKIQVTKTSNLELANTDLETLAIQDALLYPPFDNIETNYKVEVANSLEKLNILAIPQNEKARVEIVGNENLKVGKNIIEITVTAANGITKKKYQIEAYKRNEEQENEYNKEQEEMQNKLEEAYKIEKTSNNSNENVEKQKNANIIPWIVITILFIITAVGTGFWYWKRKKRI